MKRFLLLFVLILSLFALSVSAEDFAYDCSSNTLNATHCWNFEDNFNDEIGSLSATNNGAVFDTSTPFDTGKSIYADTNGDGVDLNTKLIFNTDSWTICGWWRHQDIDGGLGAIFGSDNNGAEDSIYMNVNDAGTDRLVFKLTDTTGDETNMAFDFSAQIASQDWNHLCFTANDTTGSTPETGYMHFYINGTWQAPVSSGVGTIIKGKIDNDLNLFEQPTSGRSSQGYWDNFVIWNSSSLSNEQIIQVYNGSQPSLTITSPLFPPNLTTVPRNDVIINTTVSSSVDFSGLLWVNGTLTDQVLYSADVVSLVEFNESLSDGHYAVQITVNGSGLSGNTSINTIIVDGQEPLITFTVPSAADDTVINTTSITNSILIENANLASYVYNISNGSEVIFQSEEALTGISYNIVNVTSLVGQSDQTFTSSLYVCDTGGSCVFESHTFNLDTSPPTVTLTTPLNNTAQSTPVTFTFSTTEDSTCFLYVDSIIEQQLSVVSGESSFSPYSFTESINTTWQVECSDDYGNDGFSSIFLVSVTVPEVETFFDSGVCPSNSTPHALLFGIIIFFLLSTFVVNELYIKIDGLNLFIGLALLGAGWVVAGCSAMLGVPFMAIGIFVSIFRIIIK